MGDGCERSSKGILAVQSAHLKVDDFSGDHQREELFGWGGDGRAQGLPDLHGHIGDASDHVVSLTLALLGSRHVVESRRLEEFEEMGDTGVLGNSGSAGQVL
jgi:hypothetical protein